MVRLLGCAAAALISCFFVSRYNWASALTFERGVGFPGLTRAINSGAPVAYALPASVLLLGLLLLRRYPRSEVAFEILVWLSWLGAFAWALTAIYAWQVAHILIYNAPHS